MKISSPSIYPTCNPIYIKTYPPDTVGTDLDGLFGGQGGFIKPIDLQ